MTPSHPLFRAGAAHDRHGILQNELCAPEAAVVKDSLQWLKDASAMVLVSDAPAGTAYLLTPQHAATCAHVIRRVGQGGRVALSFRWAEVSARVTAIDPTADAALLTLDDPVRVEPLRWESDPTTENDALWVAYGYPGITAPSAAQDPAPIVVRGTVRDAHATDDWNVGALQLYCEDFAAGKGAMPQGMSGSAMIVRGRLAGHLKRIVTAPDDSSVDMQSAPSRRAELGIVYACPIAAVIALLPEPLQQPRPMHRELLPPGSAYVPTCYVPREADRRAWYYAEANAPVWVQGGWRMGTSWFVAHLLDRMSNAAMLNDRSFSVIPVDLRNLGLTPDSAGDEFAGTMAFAIAQRIGGDPGRLRAAGALAWPLRLAYWMEDEILPRVKDRMILVLEHFDALSGHPIERDVCYMLRRWVDQRPLLPLWSKLQPIVASTFSPATTTLGPGVGISPVAVPAIQLEDFSSAECEALARVYGLGWSAGDIERDLRPWLGGQPFLFTVAAHHAATTGTDLAQIAVHAERADGPFGAALHAWFDELDRSTTDMDTLRRLLQDPKARLDRNEAARLRNVGLIVDGGKGAYRCRYRIQETHLRRILHLSSRA